MNLRGTVGAFLVLVGVLLIFLRARKKGDIQLAGGVWGVIEKVGDAVYITGIILVAAGVLLIAPDLGSVFKS
ncbi:hypothetical protein K1W54_14830 [Micromonospora sp. CPCC 205371]|nr:hypothetical protein [Micromonospora sp. CPCC 205371]